MRFFPFATATLFTLLAACGSKGEPEAEGPKSLLLVTIDTLRADRVGCYGYSKAETPNLDALAKRGVRFAQAQSVAPITFVAHTSLMTGTIPPHHGARDNGSHRALPELTTLAEVLRDQGYRTGAFTAAFVLDSIYGLDQGFEVYGDVPQRAAQPTSEFEERPGHEVNREALTWLRKLGKDERFFLWVHYFEPHLPYPPAADLPASFRDRPYDYEVSVADKVLGQVLAELHRGGRMQDTLVAVTSDHGEMFGEHGEETHSFFAYQGVLHVPLILAHSSLPAGRVVDERISMIDVMPTLLELLDVAPADTPPPGQSLAALMRGEAGGQRPVYFESWTPLLSYGWAPIQGVCLDDQKYIRVPRPELYELSNDPGETNNLYAADPESANRLAAALDEVLAANEDSARAARAKREMSAEERQRLANLGYTGTAADSDPELTLNDPKDGIERIQKEQRVRNLLDRGDQVAAEKGLKELLELDPNNPIFNAHLGHLRMQQNRHAEGIPHLERAIKSGLDNATTRSNLGTCFHKIGEYDKATTELNEALEQNPKHLISLFWLGRNHAAAGDKTTAKATFEKILELWDGGEGALTEQVRSFIRELGV